MPTRLSLILSRTPDVPKKLPNTHGDLDTKVYVRETCDGRL